MNAIKNEIGYHATSVKNAESILNSEFKKSISTKYKKHWLGDGVYFFTDIAWAVQWNINELRKEKNRDKNKKDFTILESVINVNHNFLLDLSSIEGESILAYLKECLIEKLKIEERVDLINKINQRSYKFLMNMLDDHGLLNNFYIIKATYIDKKEAKKVHHNDDFIFKVQCQLCIRNIKCIKQTKEYEDEEKLDELYCLLEGKGDENEKY